MSGYNDLLIGSRRYFIIDLVVYSLHTSVHPFAAVRIKMKINT